MSVIEFEVPLPPKAIRSNSRYFWAAKVKAKREYSDAVYQAACENFYARVAMGLSSAVAPWQRARVTYTWRYCGVAPDLANLGGNTKALQDFLCMAPNIGRRENGCTYLGLIEDDKGITPVYQLEKVAHRTDECVVIRIERLTTSESDLGARERVP